uniref:Uncharacterized protein n=1 Tax=Zea mays TaxID=4577 RepID=A0A804MIY3_MAIZE
MSRISDRILPPWPRPDPLRLGASRVRVAGVSRGGESACGDSGGHAQGWGRGVVERGTRNLPSSASADRGRRSRAGTSARELGMHGFIFHRATSIEQGRARERRRGCGGAGLRERWNAGTSAAGALDADWTF